MKITNTSKGIRTLQIKTKGERIETRALAPGETVDDVEIVDQNDPVFMGLVETNELVVEAAAHGQSKKVDVKG